MRYKKQYIILSGGPGGGKTSIIDCLLGRGFSCMPELAREIIKSERAKKVTVFHG